MLALKIISIILPLASAVYRDNIRALKSLPTFTNSLVNLGKMDLSFYFMAKPEDLKAYENVRQSSEVLTPKIDSVIEEPCPCTSKYARNFPKNNPSELLKNMLTGNNLFSFNKEPKTSTLCCESHENVREETIFFEFSPKQSQVKENPMLHKPLPFLPFIFDNTQNKPMLPFKPKAVEILLFPKRKDVSVNFDKEQKKEFNKEEIQIVGDKVIQNDFKTMKFMPPQPQSSVKKDLGIQEKGDTLPTKAAGIKSDAKVIKPNEV